MQELNADSRMGQPFERVIVVNSAIDEDEKDKIIMDISSEGYLGVELLSDRRYRVRQEQPTQESQHAAVLSLWRQRRAGKIKYEEGENESR